MQRKREHRIVLNRLLRDERISPNRSLLAEVLSMWLDAESDEEKAFVQDLIKNVWANPKRVRWIDEDDPQEEANRTNLEQEARDKIKDVFDQLLGSRSEEAKNA
jgi:hypothetical protein